MKNEIEILMDCYHQALLRLQAALSKEPGEDGICVDAAVHRFEVCFDLAMKLLKVMIAYEEVEVDSYRSAIREGWKQGMLTDAEVWLDMYGKSKMTTHNYNESVATQVYRQIKEEYASLLLVLDDRLTCRDVK